MPLLFGGVLLIFECSGACHNIARRMASDGYTHQTFDRGAPEKRNPPAQNRAEGRFSGVPLFAFSG